MLWVASSPGLSPQLLSRLQQETSVGMRMVVRALERCALFMTLVFVMTCGSLL